MPRLPSRALKFPHCRTSTPGDSAHKIPISLERGAAVLGQPGGNGAASQRDLLAVACTVFLEMWRGGREGSFLSLLHVPVLGEGTQSRGSPKAPFPRKGSPGQAGPWLIWLQFPVPDHPALSPLHLASTQAIPLCHQEDGKPQHKKHHVALIRHVLIRLPPCSCFQPGQTFAAEAKYSQPSSQSLMVVHIPVRASICRQQASHEQHAPRQAGRGMEVQTDSVQMEGAAMSSPLRLFLNCLSKAQCPWQQGGLFLDACFTSPRRYAGKGLPFYCLAPSDLPWSLRFAPLWSLLFASSHVEGLFKQEV